jgi:hypothetical protein
MRVFAFAFAAALAAASFTAAAQVDPDTLKAPPSARWLSIDRTSTGYVAGGVLGGMAWAFHVQGTEMKRLQSDSTFSIDGVVLQLRAVPRAAIPNAATNVLDAHKAFEQKHQQESAKGAVRFGDHAYCTQAKFPHGQWTARGLAGARQITQAIVTFEVGDYVLMVAAPYENEAREQAVARAIADVCASFRRTRI